MVVEEDVVLDEVLLLEEDDEVDDDWVGWVERVVGSEDVVADGPGPPPELAR